MGKDKVIKGVTEKEMCEKAGIDQSILSRCKAGKTRMTYGLAKKFADANKLNVWEVLSAFGDASFIKGLADCIDNFALEDQKQIVDCLWSIINVINSDPEPKAKQKKLTKENIIKFRKRAGSLTDKAQDF